MANGQQEQQSVVTNQQQGVTQPQQPTNLYQALGSLNPQQLLQLKSNVQKRAGRREIYRNVGSVRGADLLGSVETGEMTIAEAINRSKQELSPNMKTIDAAFFKEGATAANLLPLKELMKNTWTKRERNLWLSHYNALDSRETKAENKRIQRDKNISTESKKRHQNFVDNKVHFSNARTDYITVQTELERAGEAFGAGGVTENFNKYYNDFINYVNQDLNPDIKAARADQLEMNRTINKIANELPIKVLSARKGFHIDGEFIPTFKEDFDDATLRHLWAKELINRVVMAKNHTNSVKEYFEPPTEEVPTEGGGTDWSQFMVD